MLHQLVRQIIEIVRTAGKGKAFIITSRESGNKGLVLLFIDNITAEKGTKDARVRASRKPLRPIDVKRRANINRCFKEKNDNNDRRIVSSVDLLT